MELLIDFLSRLAVAMVVMIIKEYLVNKRTPPPGPPSPGF